MSSSEVVTEDELLEIESLLFDLFVIINGGSDTVH